MKQFKDRKGSESFPGVSNDSDNIPRSAATTILITVLNTIWSSAVVVFLWDNYK